MLGCTHRLFTSPVMRAVVLAMSGTRQKYHYSSVPVMAFDPAKRSFPYSKIARIMYYRPTNLSQYMFLSRSVVMNRHGALYGTACPFRAKQSNVFILLGIRFSRFTEANKKPPSLISRNEKGFYNLFSK